MSLWGAGKRKPKETALKELLRGGGLRIYRSARGNVRHGDGHEALPFRDRRESSHGTEITDKKSGAPKGQWGGLYQRLTERDKRGQKVDSCGGEEAFYGRGKKGGGTAPH